MRGHLFPVDDGLWRHQRRQFVEAEGVTERLRRRAEVVDESPVRWAEQILRPERANKLLLG